MIDLTAELYEREPEAEHPGFFALRLEKQMQRVYSALRRRERRAARRARRRRHSA